MTINTNNYTYSGYSEWQLILLIIHVEDTQNDNQLY